MHAPREITLPAVPPFDLHATVEAMRRRPNNLAEVWRDGEYRRVLAGENGPALFGVRQVAPDRIAIRALGSQLDDSRLEPATATLAAMVGAHVDLAGAQARARRVPELVPLVEALAGMKPPRFPSLWETLLAVIPFQQVSLAAGVAILNRLIEAIGPRIDYDDEIYYGLPSPAAVLGASTDTLRALGISAAKVNTLRGVAEADHAGGLDPRRLDQLDDELAVAELTELPGIGPWSAQLVLLRGLRRLSVFPQGDSGATRTLAGVLGLPIAQSHERAAEMLAALGSDRGYLYFLLLGSRLLRQGILGSETAGETEGAKT
jgi:DNA-3-methyladenine glycosylase II